MKKLIQALIVATLCAFSAFSDLNVAVSNVVTAYQNDDSRYYYTGRAGELVRNTQNQGITLFDGATEGGVSLIRPNDFYVTSPKGSGVDAGLMGEKLKAVIAIANAAATNDSSYATDPVRVIIDAGEYDVTNGLDVVGKVLLIARSDKSRGVGYTLKHLAFPLRTRNNQTPTVELNAIGTNSILRIFQGGVTEPSFTANGIRFNGEIESSVTAGSSDIYIKCLLEGDAYQSFEAGGSVFLTLDDCIVSGAINSNHADSQRVVLQAYNTRFSSTAKIYSMAINGTFSGVADYVVFDRCTVDFDTFLSGAGIAGGIYIVPGLKDCTVNATGAFTNDVGGGYTFTDPFVNTEFIGTDTTWFPNSTAANKDAMEFFYCRGVDSGMTNTAATIMFCTDQNGAAIPNQ